MGSAILTLAVRYEQDVVLTRQRAKQLAQLIGFDAQDQIRIATAVSEIARNTFQYAGGGKVEFRLEGTPQSFLILIRDSGKGIANLSDILSGQYKSATGMGLGIIGAKRLMDRFEVESSLHQGTTIVMGKALPRHARVLTPQDIDSITHALIQQIPQNPLDEIQQQNQELLRALEEVRHREEQLSKLNRELEDTNRGVVALYAELDEKADSLRRANDLKSCFLSNMSHEFRTPLNSIISLSRILLDRIDGDLTSEQEKQVTYIRAAAEGLSELVNDLLDLAKVEAGKVSVHPSEFEVSELFAALRGMLRPLLLYNSSVSLIFEDPVNVPKLYTDEGKVAQILRNFISNALKYTEKGEIRISAKRVGDNLNLVVSDTGIGIAPEDQERIFEDFVQIQSPLQHRVKGTGLGLPLSRKLVELLGGKIALQSNIGFGSIFSASIPLVYPDATREITTLPFSGQIDDQRLPVLVVEDNADALFIYEKDLEHSPYQMIPALSVEQASQLLEKVTPTAIILDVLLKGQNTWAFLKELKRTPKTEKIPTIVITVMDNQKQALAFGADAFLFKPVDRLSLIHSLNKLVHRGQQQKLLLIDDDLVDRYVLKQQLQNKPFKIIEADRGHIGLKLAQSEQPQGIVLDLKMPELSGLDVLNELKNNPATCSIPVIIHTSQQLDAAEQQFFRERVVAILSKDHSSPEIAATKLHEALIKAGLVLEAEGLHHG